MGEERRAYDYFVVAYAVPGPDRRVVWVVHAVSRTNNDLVVTEEISHTSGGLLLMHVVQNCLPRTGPVASLVPSGWGQRYGAVIESFSIDPHAVRDQVCFSWVDSFLIVVPR